MFKISLLATLLALASTNAIAEESAPDPDSVRQLANEAEMLCLRRSAKPLEDCVRDALTPAENQVLAVVTQADAKAAAEQRAAQDAYFLEVAEQLVLTEHPRALLLAARLLMTTVEYWPDGPRNDDAAHAIRERVGELVRAAALRGENYPSVLWTIASGGFSQIAPELVPAAIAHLRKREPENLAVWLLGGTSEPWSAEHLAQAAAAKRLDWNYYGRVREDVQRLEAFPVPGALKSGLAEGIAVSDRSVHAIISLGYLMAEAIPSLTGLTEVCIPGRDGWTDANRQNCQRISRVMGLNSDTILGAQLGNRLRYALATTDAARDAAQQAQRLVEYQSGVWGEYSSKPENYDDVTERLLAPGATEMSLIRGAATFLGKPDVPPARWRSAQERRQDEVAGSPP